MNLPSQAATSLLERLARNGYPRIEAAQLDQLAEQTPHLLVMLNEDPFKYPEVSDNAVIVPEVLRALPADAFHVVFADLPDSRLIARRYGIVKFPALLFLRQNQYVGVIAGLMNWPEIVQAVADKLTQPLSRPPSVGVPVCSAQPNGACL